MVQSSEVVRAGAKDNRARETGLIPTKQTDGLKRVYRRRASLMSFTATLADRGAFLEALRAANILSANQYAKARSLATTGSAADAAATLVSANLITRFQADSLLAGRINGLVLGQHIVLEQIGRGTMSRVYKAKHRTMNRLVAIKVLSSELTRTAAARQNFQREIRAAGKLTHPNIVTAYDASELHDRFYLVLEFVDGPNFESYVRQRGPLPAGEACEFIRQVASGLQHAHEKGMIHRDIKPANLLVARPTPSAPLTVKIADFGISKANRGVADFGAPEQYDSCPLPVDHRADLYSLGCVFYFLLTGLAPFAGGTPEEKKRRHLREEPPPLFQVRPDLPPEVAAIVHKLLAKYPAARFASAEELLQQLDSACVPVAISVEGEINFDVPTHALNPAHDSGFLTESTEQAKEQTFPLPGSNEVSGQVSDSPWSHLTDEVLNESETLPIGLTDTPFVSPPRRLPLPGRGESVPIWMIATLLTSVVLMCLMGIGIVMKLLAK